MDSAALCAAGVSDLLGVEKKQAHALMQPEKGLSMKTSFKIKRFLKRSTFFQHPPDLARLRQCCDERYGSGAMVYLFERRGFAIELIAGERTQTLVGEQMLICHEPNVRQRALRDWFTLEKLQRSKWRRRIRAVYGDDDERVVFLKSGVNAFYWRGKRGKWVLAKITGWDKLSRSVVRQVMRRLEAA